MTPKRNRESVETQSRRYEAGHDILASALQKLEETFRAEGVVFVEEDKVLGTGVRVKKRPASK
jgi:hypothetical protein